MSYLYREIPKVCNTLPLQLGLFVHTLHHGLLLHHGGNKELACTYFKEAMNYLDQWQEDPIIVTTSIRHGVFNDWGKQDTDWPGRAVWPEVYKLITYANTPSTAIQKIDNIKEMLTNYLIKNAH